MGRPTGSDLGVEAVLVPTVEHFGLRSGSERVAEGQCSRKRLKSQRMVHIILPLPPGGY
jgi:hypothetical protein